MWKGWKLTNVEGLEAYALNAKLLDGCIKRQQAKLRGQTETIAERMKRDRAALMAFLRLLLMPAIRFPRVYLHYRSCVIGPMTTQYLPNMVTGKCWSKAMTWSSKTGHPVKLLLSILLLLLHIGLDFCNPSMNAVFGCYKTQRYIAK
jgi:hypothetical protein